MVDSAKIELDGTEVAGLFPVGGFPKVGVSNLEKMVFSGVSTDSRTVGPGELFFALVGDDFNGHDFVGDAVLRGAMGLVIDKGHASKVAEDLVTNSKASEIAVMVVDDTLFALGELASQHRGNLNGMVVGITGSNGKTTTKEMTASVTATKFVTEKSEGNFNNLIGLPMMLLSMAKTDEVVVLELGMNVPGEMERLVEIARPEIGVITNIGPVHLEGVGSIEGVVREKSQIVTALPLDGTAVINGDSEYCLGLVEKINSRILTFGIEGDNDVSAVDIEDLGQGGMKAQIVIPGGKFLAHLKIPGIHNLKNALAAVSVGVALGISKDEIKAGIEAVRSIKMRMEMITTNDEIVILNDSYNANTVSVKAAIGFLAKEAKVGGGRLIAVLGDMLELGDYTVLGHEEVGEEAVAVGASYLFLLGNNAEDTARGAINAGFSSTKISVYPAYGHEKLIRDLKDVLKPNDRVVVKGSRGMKMEIIVSGIVNGSIH
jgi:UDP-N-acetylmuramoyl-tripeptide--D-alanyl-D-alanine ligase